MTSTGLIQRSWIRARRGDHAMNVQFRDRPAPDTPVQVKTAIADGDIHPARATKTELYPYLAKRWHAHLETYDKHQYQGMICLLYTSDAADEEDSVDLGGRRIIKKKKK